MHVQAITRLTLFQINSRGFKSDESGGERRVLFHIPLHTVCTVSFVWCDLKLSLITTISLPDSSRVSHSRIRRHHLTSKPFTATAQCSSVCRSSLALQFSSTPYSHVLLRNHAPHKGISALYPHQACSISSHMTRSRLDARR
jgi:hypothetical protein